jgi:hypothetical protein
MSTNRQAIRELISPFDANLASSAADASTEADQRTEAFLAKLRARVEALDAVEHKLPQAKKTPKRRSTAQPATPDWYEAQPTKETKPAATTKRFVSDHPYPGRRRNKPKAE